MKLLGQVKRRVQLEIQAMKLRFRPANQAVRIVVGASGVFQEGWYPTDIENLDLTSARDWRRYFQPNSVDAILAEHVWEHLAPKDALLAADNCFTFLKPGGYLRAAVPDGYHFSEQYLRAVEPGGFGAGSDDHKVLYDYRSFAKLFEEAGFEVHLLEYFDADRKFHFNEWSPDQGMIIRSSRFDDRNQNGELNYTSLIIDAFKK